MTEKAEVRQLDPKEYAEYYNAVAHLYQRGLFTYQQAYYKLMDVLLSLGYPVEAAEEQAKNTLLSHNPR